ncbi:MAG: hypothetical protein ACAH83_11395 [Alphaproteobacteria bacterium]
MGLSDSFNDVYAARKENDTVLRVHYDTLYNYYDFTARMLTTCNGSNSVAVVPFSQLDRETLIAMRDKLVELKGNPPELPPEEAVIKAVPKKFNL